MIAALIWLGLFATYLSGVAGSFYFEDSPELLAAASILGNSHEPGYPLWLLASRLAFLIPAGGPAFRVNILGAAVSAAAAVMLGRLVAAILRDSGRGPVLSGLSGLFATLLWGLSDTFWWQAGIGDKYPALHLGCVVVLWASWYALDAGFRGLVVLGLACGLAAAIHPFSLFMLPAAGCGAAAALGAFDRERAVLGRRRAVALAALAFLLPLSVRAIYPPVRAVADLDWGDPATSDGLTDYVLVARYRAPDVPGSVPQVESAGRAGSRLFARLTFEELPWAFLVPALAGLVWGLARAPVWTLAVPWVIVLNLAFAIHTPVKVARWYGPAWGVMVLFSGLGLGLLASLIRRPRVAAAVAGVCCLLVWTVQGVRGIWRNDFSRWYAAHDYARNLLSSLPKGAVYLGRGDDDLFTLWAARWAEGVRPDVDAVGMGSLVDIRPADAGGVRRLAARFHLAGPGWEALRWLLAGPPHPEAWYGKTGYDATLWGALDLGRARTRGLVARLPGRWDGSGSWADTRRAVRGYTWRGLLYARSGGVFDLGRLRDEGARDALLHCAFCFSSLGTQFLMLDGPRRAPEAAWCYSMARRLAEPLTGPVPVALTGPSPMDAAVAERNALATGIMRLSDLFAARGVRPVANRYLAAVGTLQLVVGRGENSR